jgi:hypothetical protein
MTQANGLVDLKPPIKGAGVAGADMRRRLQLCGTSGAQRHRPCALRGQYAGPPLLLAQKN